MKGWKLAYQANCWGPLGGNAVGVTSISVLFQQNKVAHRLNTDQAALWVKGFVLGEADVTRLHLVAQPLIFFLAELDD